MKTCAPGNNLTINARHALTTSACRPERPLTHNPTRSVIDSSSREDVHVMRRLINPTNLTIDMHPDEERRLARYLDEVPAPIVIALNSVAVAGAVHHLMLAVTALHEDNTDTAAVLHRPRGRDRDMVVSRQDPTCRACGLIGQLGRGDH